MENTDLMSEKIRLDSIEEAIEEVKNGKVVIVVDDEDRENEGDFICAAESVTPEIVNFMATSCAVIISVNPPLILCWIRVCRWCREGSHIQKKYRCGGGFSQ